MEASYEGGQGPERAVASYMEWVGLIKGTDLGKKNSEDKMCFDLIYSFVWNISHSKNKYAGYDQKCILVFM